MLRTQYYTTNTAEMQEKKSLIYKNRQYFSKIVSRHKKTADVCGFFVRRYCSDKKSPHHFGEGIYVTVRRYYRLKR
jgi:hypothetical protein